jgi:hypothetical protein
VRAEPLGAEQPPEAWAQFYVTSQQLENSRLRKVLCRQGLWRQGVGFGVNFDQGKSKWFVMIHPGRAGLTAGRCSTASWVARHEPPHRILRPRSYPPAMRRSCSRSRISNTRPAERM